MIGDLFERRLIAPILSNESECFSHLVVIAHHIRRFERDIGIVKCEIGQGHFAGRFGFIVMKL